MCVIVTKDQNAEIELKELRAMWDLNEHGAGVAWYDKHGKLNMRKGFMTLKSFLRFWHKNRLADKMLVAHFRIATHGAVVEKFTHPFPCGKDTYLFHNGVVSGFGSKNVSDSMEFADLLSDLPGKHWENVINLAVSDRSKFCVINNTGLVRYGDFTEIRKGIHTSNTYWRYRASSPTQFSFGNSYHEPYRGCGYYDSNGNFTESFRDPNKMTDAELLAEIEEAERREKQSVGFTEGKTVELEKWLGRFPRSAPLAPIVANTDTEKEKQRALETVVSTNLSESLPEVERDKYEFVDPYDYIG